MLNPSAIAGSWQSKKTYFQCIIDRKIIHISLKPKTSQNCGRTSFSVKLLDFPRSMKVHNTIAPRLSLNNTIKCNRLCIVKKVPPMIFCPRHQLFGAAEPSTAGEISTWQRSEFGKVFSKSGNSLLKGNSCRLQRNAMQLLRMSTEAAATDISFWPTFFLLPFLLFGFNEIFYRIFLHVDVISM